MTYEKKLLEKEEIPLKSRISVTGADASVALMQTIIGGGALVKYFQDFRGLDPILAAIVLLLWGVWNMVNDPLYGYISDKTRHRLGRRIPYIRYGAPFLGLSYIISWIFWPAGSQIALFLQLFLFLFFYDTLYTAIASALYVMPYEMAVSSKARGSIFVWKVFFSAFAMLTPLIILPLIQENIAIYQTFNIVLGIIVTIIVFGSTYFYKEKGYHQEEETVPFLESLKKTFKNKPFIIFEVVSFTIIFVQAGLMMGLLYYVQEIETNIFLLFGALVGGIFVGVYLFMIRGIKLGVKKSMQIMLFIFSLACLLILLFGRFLIPTMIGFGGIGVGLVGGLYLIPLMNGDVIDWDEHKTGERREGMYAGVNSFITKYAASLAQGIFLFMISAYGYKTSLIGNNNTLAETGIIIGWMLFPTILLFLSLLATYWYPLEGEEWEKIKSKLEEKHQKKEKEHLESLGYKYEQ